jgi:hypothetical protein
LIAQIVELAKIIVLRTSPSNQQALLDNLIANLATIASQRPQLVACLSVITSEQANAVAIIDEAEAGWVLYENRQGQWLALTTQAGSVGRAQTIAQNDSFQFAYFLGIGFGEEVMAWHAHTGEHPPADRIPGFIPPIFLIEPSAIYFLLFLLTGNRQALLADERFYAFIGQHAFEDYLQWACLHPTNYPTARLNYSFASDRNLLESQLEMTLQTIARHQNTLASAAMNEMAVYYDAQFGQRLAEKIAQKRYSDIKILGLTCRYSTFVQYCTRDLLAGFNDLGCQTELMIEPNSHYMLTGHHKVTSIYHALPDIIINIDNLRSETIPTHVPHHTWIQDELAQLVSPTIEPLTKYDFVDVFGSGWLQRFQQRPYYAQHPIDVLPLAFHEGTYFPLTQTDKDIDVLYVSHLIDPELTLAPYRSGRLPSLKTHEEKVWFNQGGQGEVLAHAMQHIAQAIDVLTMNELLSLFESQDKRTHWLHSLSITVLTDDLLQLLIEPTGHRGRIGNEILSQLKVRPMQALANAGIAMVIYGKYWEHYSDLAPFAQGSADNGEALNQLQNRSKICINNSALVSFHMRALEIMASGAFMLSRRIPIEYDIMPITELFAEGVDVALFDESNVVEQVGYYLANDTERETMAQAALVKLREHHTYKQRAEQVLRNVMQRFI